ncbi:AI-2E family transporter [Leptolyngbya sp. PCC 6406]|uniref:AI-2E family transporter n=1 Tax=Leptolyngbya sp. PCC 6406 TaxID=1173264 RepID=UPI0002AC21C8|nr:AI-2E family transporter [Leptolyngbya sp. PCC 6406]
MKTNRKPSFHFLHRLSIIRLIRYLLLLTLGWVIAQVLGYFQTVITIFTFSAILAFLLNYPVTWITRFVPRSMAVTITFTMGLLFLSGVITTLGSTILNQGQQLITQSPEIVDAIIPLIERLNTALNDFNIQLDLTELTGELRGQILSGIDIGLSVVQGIISNIIDLILVAVVTFFMLLEGEPIWNFVINIFPISLQGELTTAIKINLLGFFWGRLLLSIFFAVSCFVVFVVLKIPYALLLATIAGLFDLIPGIGATMGVALIAFIALPQGLWISFQIIGICVFMQQIEENLLMPRIMQGSINMNPVVLFFALLVGARVAGLLGLFLSVPIAGVIISLFGLEALQGGKSTATGLPP